ncbi:MULTISPECIES: type VI secretion system PAAR protein [unclassified Thioalkalivibrio]|uniref:type VI secretion system PAAR protein n=1 Tax=unclassified Thioalkalivibrio TaxID=2621013 RepID=UPI0003A2BD58|nr:MULTISPECIES: type VI secretion system PAAR protein [unclassified Thioalkalivibrio]
MSKTIMVVGDLDTGHDGYPPTPVISGSPSVFVNGRPVAREGDPLAPHKKSGKSTHTRNIAPGGSTVLVDGRPVALTGHPVSCGGVMVGGGGSGVVSGS